MVMIGVGHCTDICIFYMHHKVDWHILALCHFWFLVEFLMWQGGGARWCRAITESVVPMVGLKKSASSAVYKIDLTVRLSGIMFVSWQ